MADQDTSTEERLQKIINDIKSSARGLEDGNIDSLFLLRGSVLDIDLPSVAKQLNDREVAVLYVTKKLVRDLFGNFATDAGFGFPSEVIIRSNFLQSLGHFLISSLFSEPRENLEMLEALFTTIKSYYIIVSEVDENIEQFLS
ncbi:MAG: hypothetical protein KAW02_03080 [candidate division Zixibacteria bacterium]|nr:hypothetical protein [candidate division Zixibacteria bacterium]